ncbi:MAG: LytTR family DNA-binding domain-containing protein [Bacteroidota bacterium]
MKILIIEDEAPAFRRLQQLINEVIADAEIIDVIDTIEDSVKWLKNQPSPDLIFMDIQLADGLSFEIFEETEVNCPVIFTTAFDEYTLQAFKVNSIDYLLKPIKKEELTKSLQKLQKLKETLVGSNNDSGAQQDLSELVKAFKQNSNPYKSRFLVKLGERLISLSEEEIAYFYAEDGYVLIKTKANQKYTIDYTLDELEKVLNPHLFFRLNRQFIARFQAIDEIHAYFKGKIAVSLSPSWKENIIVSREKAPLFKTWLNA